MSTAINGATIVLLLFGLSKPVTAFLSQYRIDQYTQHSTQKLHYTEPVETNAIIATAPLQHDIFSNVTEEDPLYTEKTQNPYSLASKLNVAHVPLNEHGFQYPIEVIGHRGSPYKFLENTTPSFLHAAQVGADGIELDVFLLKCGSLVVFHGSGGDRQPGLLQSYCGVEGSILDYTAEDAKRLLTFNKNFEEFGCGPNAITHPDDGYSHYCYVHTLQEVLENLRDHTDVSQNFKIKIELKGPGTALPSIELVRKLNMDKRCQYSSFDHSRIAEVRMLDADAITGALFENDVPDDFVQQCLAVGANEVHFKYDTCTYERVRAAHLAGLNTMAWFRGPAGMADDYLTKYFDVGNEDEAMYRTVLLSGVKSMCVNRPDVLAKSLVAAQAVNSHLPRV
ncbi:hypothetical protein ACHAXR_006304 [Thalassiosira sp. AJA248-18]